MAPFFPQGDFETDPVGGGEVEMVRNSSFWGL